MLLSAPFYMIKDVACGGQLMERLRDSFRSLSAARGALDKSLLKGSIIILPPSHVKAL